MVYYRAFQYIHQDCKYYVTNLECYLVSNIDKGNHSFCYLKNYPLFIIAKKKLFIEVLNVHSNSEMGQLCA